MLYFLSERIRHYIYLLTEIHGDAKKTLRTLKIKTFLLISKANCVCFVFPNRPMILRGSPNKTRLGNSGVPPAPRRTQWLICASPKCGFFASQVHCPLHTKSAPFKRQIWRFPNFETQPVWDAEDRKIPSY